MKAGSRPGTSQPEDIDMSKYIFISAKHRNPVSFPCLFQRVSNQWKPLIESFLWVILFLQRLQPDKTVSVHILQRLISVRKVNVSGVIGLARADKELRGNRASAICHLRAITGSAIRGAHQIAHTGSESISCRIEAAVSIQRDRDNMDWDVTKGVGRGGAAHRNRCLHGIVFGQDGGIGRLRILGHEAFEFIIYGTPDCRVETLPAQRRSVRGFPFALHAERVCEVAPLAVREFGGSVGGWV